MIPAKIISFEEALRMGLTKKSKISGVGVVAAGLVAKKNKDGEDEIVEKSILKEDGTVELVFMEEERKNYLKKDLKYFDNFTKILGEDKESFLKKEKLKEVGNKDE